MVLRSRGNEKKKKRKRGSYTSCTFVVLDQATWKHQAAVKHTDTEKGEKRDRERSERKKKDGAEG